MIFKPAGADVAWPKPGAGAPDPWWEARARTNGSGPSVHHIGTPVIERPDAQALAEEDGEDVKISYARHKVKDIYEEKRATNKEHKYSEKEPQ